MRPSKCRKEKRCMAVNKKHNNEGLMTFLDILNINGAGKVPERFRILFDRSRFAADTLDVSPMYPYADPSKCVITFEGLPSHLFEISRIMARFLLFGGAAPRTVQNQINYLNIFFQELPRTTYIIDFRFLTTEDIQKTLQRSGWTSDKCRKICTALDKMYSTATAVYDRRMLRVDLKELALIRKRYTSRSTSTRNAHKTPNIDEDYFEELNARLPVIARNKRIPINYRMTSAMTQFKIWTGLRTSEPFTVTTDSLEMKKDSKGKDIPYLKYTVEKLSQGGSRKVTGKTVLLPGAEEAFNLMLDLRKKIPGYKKTKKLFILDGPKSARLGYRYYKERLFTDYLPELTTGSWESVKTRNINGQEFRIPSDTQYRVHLCSWLYHVGISLPIIEMGMSHLVADMHAYYVRVKDVTFNKEQRRVDNIVRTATNNDFDIDDHQDRGRELLNGLVLAVKRFEVFTTKYEQVEKKGYAQEMKNYKNNILGVLNSEIVPALDYLEQLLDREGREGVLEHHPMLSRIIDNIENHKTTFDQWQERISIH